MYTIITPAMNILEITERFITHKYDIHNMSIVIDFLKAMHPYWLLVGTGDDCEYKGFDSLEELKGSDIYAEEIRKNALLQSRCQVQ